MTAPRPEVPTDAQPWTQPAIAFVLFDRPAPSPDEVGEILTEVFSGQAPVEPADENSTASSVTLQDAVVLAQPIDDTVPDGQASLAARDLAAWNGEEAVVDGHLSHVVVTSVRPDAGTRTGTAGTPDLDPYLDALRRELAVAHVAAAVTALDGAVAVYVAAASTLPAAPYRSVVAEHPIPVPALVGVRAGWQTEGVACVYTTGLHRFGRLDLERLDMTGHPGEAYGQMCDLVAFALGTGTVFAPGQTLEVGDGRSLTVALETSPLTGSDVLRLSPA